jgi:hypothetical protein
MTLQVTDTKVIDMLVVKGQMELDEVHNFWKQKTHVVCTVLAEETAVSCGLLVQILPRFHVSVAIGEVHAS